MDSRSRGLADGHADMLAFGRPAPVIAEVDGPHVRVVQLGGGPDAAVIDLVAALTPASCA